MSRHFLSAVALLGLAYACTSTEQRGPAPEPWFVGVYEGVLKTENENILRRFVLRADGRWSFYFFFGGEDRDPLELRGTWEATDLADGGVRVRCKNEPDLSRLHPRTFVIRGDTIDAVDPDFRMKRVHGDVSGSASKPPANER